jgi:hypothetical protein
LLFDGLETALTRKAALSVGLGLLKLMDLFNQALVLLRKLEMLGHVTVHYILHLGGLELFLLLFL